MRTRSQPKSPNGFLSLEMVPRRRTTRSTAARSAATASSTASSSTEPPKPQPEPKKAAPKRAPPKKKGRKKAAAPRKKKTATSVPAEEVKDDPVVEQPTVLTETENTAPQPLTPSEIQPPVSKSPSTASASRKRSHDAVDGPDNPEDVPPASKRLYRMAAAVARQRLREYRPYGERRRRRLIENQGFLNTSMFRLSQITTPTSDDKENNPYRPKLRRVIIQENPDDNDSTSDSTPQRPETPTRPWSWRSLLSSVPRTISQVLSPRRAAAANTEGVENQPKSAEKPRDLTYSLYPPPMPRPEILLRREAYRAARASVPQDDQATANVTTPTTPQSKNLKRKRDIPDVIPNPVGTSYGMDLDYFCYSTDDEEEPANEIEDTTAPTPAPNGESRTPSSSSRRAKKRVRFDLSPQNTPSKLRARSMLQETETSWPASPASEVAPQNSSPRESSGITSQSVHEPESTGRAWISSSPSVRGARRTPTPPAAVEEPAPRRSPGRTYGFSYDDFSDDDFSDELFPDFNSPRTRSSAVDASANAEGEFVRRSPGRTYGFSYDDFSSDSELELQEEEFEKLHRLSEAQTKEQSQPEQDEGRSLSDISIPDASSSPQRAPETPTPTRFVDTERARKYGPKSEGKQQVTGAGDATVEESNTEQAVVTSEATIAGDSESRPVLPPSWAQRPAIPETPQVSGPETSAASAADPVMKARSLAEKYKPRLPSGLRASKRYSSPMAGSFRGDTEPHDAHGVPSFQWPLAAALEGVPAVEPMQGLFGGLAFSPSL
ncbi:hypothetical protein VTO42DRAFT_2972 [Malbranchea cinnamomea]